MSEDENGRRPEQSVTVTVDNSPVTSPRDTTAGAVLQAAGLDPAKRRLVLVQGRHTTEYAAGDELSLHPNEQFITVATGPTPVS